MKLIPAALFIIAVFLAGLLFREGRGHSRAVLLLPIAVLLLLSGILFMIVGRIALLIALISIAVFLIVFKKR